MMKKYGFVGLNGAVTFDFSKNVVQQSDLSNAVSTSLNNVASAARLSDQRPRTHTYGEQRLNCTIPPVSVSKRALSVRQQKTVDWSDVPPLIPPREPLRTNRTSPPLRSSSTPSPRTSPQLLTSSSTSNVSSDCGRKYQSSTTAVFSALPSALSSSSPVILPIMKDGVQESHTHYFLLGDDKVIITSLFSCCLLV